MTTLTDRARPELAPCPFCGDPMRIEHGNLVHVKEGDDCPIGIYGWGGERFIAGWNRRTPDAAILEAEKRGAAREREELAALYDAVADELDKQSVDALSVGEKLRLDETAKKHRDFAAYLRNRESNT